MNQRTLANSFTLRGVGLHTGAEVELVFKPAPAGHGIKFQRVDLAEHPLIAADVNRVISTDRSTTIGTSEASVSTVEHLLSAVSGVQLDNLLVEINGPEIPILDGSASPFVEPLLAAGFVEQDLSRDFFIVEEPITYRDEASGSEIVALPYDGFEVVSMIDFDSPVLGQQYATLKRYEDYVEDIAPCRTFVFLHELEALFEHDLIKGGDLTNAIVIADRHVPQERLDKLARRMGKETVEVTKKGILNTLDLKFHNEPARHKLLDVMGDIALLGVPIRGRILATKPGHGANVAFTKLLKRAYLEQKRTKGRPHYNPNDEPVYNLVQIQSIMPHRYPFLLIDKIIEKGENHIVGVKNMTGNEEFFQGHFPGNPVMPGVLQIEAMAQTGGLLVLTQQDDPYGWDTYFLKVENAKFKSFVVPGDTVIFKMELIAPVRRGICQMVGTAYVGNRIVSEAELVAQIVKRP
ncbi:bifunctional UDP-3-O-[3-hydroxymyristoyl] N-acetylglucosamine deacetylase/3-hydroxyacyl-ACP dehydratase [Neolewinella lacunae]|uniref:UDP-3-O-acyl-N-acetylglucosamine deacetylase n=1 Tax=Neolewinella lacunae TaxID=1517758 RepID=A0A923T9A0_9BACT|nr:bifunctional UDP-3-O-[3-hydroxymyristoyl] N-acetylglucosamine deacetylase/3-hydroxyacyl-ACP dehydratase [Neolewinella lacunae]MBC6996505.1 bifunctional UDP-3-O-[3-hydroxymyristoyl] N-acetylglucosamine deacetylase/3-hydroxyacyl-ACP dehydratase [Neolewinella lacunae]MDN3636658.1 bifunctional UDP-3-O-[3-hydroxymyristoyl] N-acetylglucosamine deacetylase/3-hydroxyacyl-ACP dehydratase [Neolewinella lacunae]